MSNRAIILLTTAFLLAGCNAFSPKEDPSRFFVLTAQGEMLDEPGTQVAPEVQVFVGLRRVEVPDYLRRSQFAKRMGASEVLYSDILRWAEPLEQGLRRVIAGNLDKQLPEAAVIVEPYPRGIQPKAEILLRVVRFESVPKENTVAVSLEWEIKASVSEDPRRKGITSRQIPVESGVDRGESLVAAFNTALAQASADIALELKKIKEDA